jgi:hypothetical protein
MKTEEEPIQARGPRHAAPASLQDLAPRSATIIDSRGRPVPVCSSGFVLRAGRSYRLRLACPADTGFLSVKVLAPPEFLRTDTDSEVPAVAQGLRVRDLPFRVRQNLGGALLKLGGLITDELEVRLHFRGAGKAPLPMSYPIVVRPGPELLFGALITALLSVAGSLLLPELLSAERTHGLGFWVYAGFGLAGLLVVLVAAAYALASLQLRHRSRELRSLFDERYPPLSEG